MEMALYIVVKEGLSQGESYAVTDGLTFGRRGAGVRLDDQKVSSKHAIVQLSPDGGFELTDLNSKNGLFQGGRRVSTIALVPGAEFQIGQTTFTVLGTREGQSVEVEPVASPPKPSKKRWNEMLAHFLRKSFLHIENQPIPVQPMRPALVLDFLRGPQAETRWVLGYGPRKVGRNSVDLPIYEADASPTCFEVFPSSEGISFTAHGEEVRLNGERVSTEILKIGDRIQIFGTEIEVDFTE
jgi:pSer/pThr/pTyr-binding forkhead associated (FHA) protein